MSFWRRKSATNAVAPSAPATNEPVVPSKSPPRRPTPGVIEDPVLAQRIWRTLGTPLSDRHVITVDQMATLTGLDLHGVPITNLAGLQHAVDLQSLDVDFIAEPAAMAPIAGLRSLKTFTLHGWSGALPEGIAALSNLTDVRLYGVSSGMTFRAVSLEWLRGNPRLRSLSLFRCRLFLEPLAGHPELEHLRLNNVLVHDQQTIAELPGLKTLQVSDGILKDLSPIGHLSSLTTLELGRLQLVTDLTPLRGLHDLTTLKLEDLERVTDLTPLRELSNLTTLKIIQLDNVQELGVLSELSALNDLTLHGPILTDFDRDLVSLEPVDRLTTLTALSLKNWYRRCSDFPALTTMSGLQKLELNDVPVWGLDAVGSLTQLAELSLWGLPEVTDAEPLAALTRLEHLTLIDVPLATLSPVSELRRLTHLSVGYSEGPRGCRESATADVNFARLTQLEHLELWGMPLHSLGALRFLKALTRLQLDELPITDIEGLEYLENLERLGMRHLEVECLRPVAGLGHLTSVDIWGLPIQSIAPLAGLTNLTYVGLLFLEKVNDLSPLSGLSKLTTVELSRLSEVNDVSALANLHNLKNLRVDYMPQVDLDLVADVARNPT